MKHQRTSWIICKNQSVRGGTKQSVSGENDKGAGGDGGSRRARGKPRKEKERLREDEGLVGGIGGS